MSRSVAKDESQLASWIHDADRLLIVAAAGLSINPQLPNNPYHNPRDFALHYPALTKYGYRTSFQAMGLSQDTSVPLAIKSAHMAQHFLNMRYEFPPTSGYKCLLEIAEDFPPDNVFCWTSNVDGCFERVGFQKEHIYTTQGEMNKLQCAGDCGIVWECSDQLREMEKNIKDGELQDMSLVPKCPRCGGGYLPNLRGGDWFIHEPYANTSTRLKAWLDDAVAQKAKVAVIEVGVGPNTPIVTKIPAMYFASAVVAAGGEVSYIRVNPDPPQHNDRALEGANFCHLQMPWAVLEKILAEYRKQPARKRADIQAQLMPLADENGKLQYSPTFQDGVAGNYQKEYHSVLNSLWTPRERAQ